MFVGARQFVALNNNAGGEQTDPRAEDVLAITDALAAGTYLCQLTLTAVSLDDSKALFEVRHRNAADDDTLESVVVAVPVDDSRQYELVFTVADGEWIAVGPYVDLTGTLFAAITVVGTVT